MLKTYSLPLDIPSNYAMLEVSNNSEEDRYRCGIRFGQLETVEYLPIMDIVKLMIMENNWKILVK